MAFSKLHLSRMRMGRKGEETALFQLKVVCTSILRTKQRPLGGQQSSGGNGGYGMPCMVTCQSPARLKGTDTAGAPCLDFCQKLPSFAWRLPFGCPNDSPQMPGTHWPLEAVFTCRQSDRFWWIHIRSLTWRHGGGG